MTSEISGHSQLPEFLLLWRGSTSQQRMQAGKGCSPHVSRQFVCMCKGSSPPTSQHCEHMQMLLSSCIMAVCACAKAAYLLHHSTVRMCKGCSAHASWQCAHMQRLLSSSITEACECRKATHLLHQGSVCKWQRLYTSWQTGSRVERQEGARHKITAGSHVSWHMPINLALREV